MMKRKLLTWGVFYLLIPFIEAKEVVNNNTALKDDKYTIFYNSSGKIDLIIRTDYFNANKKGSSRMFACYDENSVNAFAENHKNNQQKMDNEQAIRVALSEFMKTYNRAIDNNSQPPTNTTIQYQHNTISKR